MHQRLVRLLAVLKALREEHIFKELLALALHLGTLINVTYRRPASASLSPAVPVVGCSLASLLKFKDYKDNSEKKSLMDLLARLAMDDHKLCNIEGQLLPLLNDCRFYDFGGLQMTLRELKHSFCLLTAPPNRPHSERTTKFGQLMAPFVTECKVKIEAVTTACHAVESQWKSVAAYFGEDPASLTLEEYLRMWYSILLHLVSSYKDSCLASSS